MSCFTVTHLKWLIWLVFFSQFSIEYRIDWVHSIDLPTTFFVIYTSLCWLKYLQCASSNLMIMKLFKKKTLGNCECTLNDLRECRKITTTIYTQINEFNVMQRPCTMCVLERLYDRALHMPLFSINAGQP